jgi:hypothetical protein
MTGHLYARCTLHGSYILFCGTFLLLYLIDVVLSQVLVAAVAAVAAGPVLQSAGSQPLMQV